MKVVLTAAVVLSALAWSSPAFAGAEDLCLSVMKGDIKDRESRYSEEDTFRRYQNVIKNAHFRDYQEMSDQGGSLGLNIPIADALLGISAEGKSNSGSFRKEVDEFLNSTYDEARSHSQQDIRKETINSQLLSVVENCHNQYFGSLRNLVGLSTTVDLNDYSSFTVSLESTIPASTEQGLIIKQIEPIGLVRCTENGEPVALDKARPSQLALMECTKDPDKRVNLRIRTNAGISNLMVLPSPPPPEKPRPPAPPPLASKGYEWTETAQAWPDHEMLPAMCPCATIVNKQGPRGYLIVNNCSGPFSVAILVDDVSAVDPLPPRSSASRRYTLVSVAAGKTTEVNTSQGKYDWAIQTNCPDPVDLRVR